MAIAAVVTPPEIPRYLDEMLARVGDGEDKTMAEDDLHTGGCLCGAVLYELRGPLRPVVNCHCGQCRKTHGHIGAYTNVARDRFRLANDSGLSWYVSSELARRGFCRVCGSSLFWERRGGDVISIAAGTLDQPTGLRTVAQIFTAPEHRGDYYEIDPTLETFPGTMGT